MPSCGAAADSSPRREPWVQGTQSDQPRRGGRRPRQPTAITGASAVAPRLTSDRRVTHGSRRGLLSAATPLLRPESTVRGVFAGNVGSRARFSPNGADTYQPRGFNRLLRDPWPRGGDGSSPQAGWRQAVATPGPWKVNLPGQSATPPWVGSPKGMQPGRGVPSGGWRGGMGRPFRALIFANANLGRCPSLVWDRPCGAEDRQR